MVRPRAVRANGQATQERILEVARNMFAANGYEATALRQIAAAADVDTATLKYHFADKPTLFGEVYREGHHRFLETLSPILGRMDRVDSREALRELIDDFVVAMHDFVQANFTFVRMTLFRMLEDSEDIILVEEELQVLALGQIDARFRHLVQRGLLEPFDTRAFIVFLVASFSTWHVTGRVKPHWLGAPGLDATAGRARSEMFFVGMMEKYLGLQDAD